MVNDGGPRVLGIGGSPRAKGNSDLILQAVLEGVASQGTAIEKVALRDYLFQPCIGCERCRQAKACTGLNDGMQLLYPKIIRSKGLVLVSPTHNYNVTAWMKAFIDRLYCFYEFSIPRPGPWSSRLAGQERKAIVATVCEQETNADMGFTLEAMAMPLAALGYDIVDRVAIFGRFARGDVKKDSQALARLSDAGRHLARSLS